MPSDPRVQKTNLVENCYIGFVIVRVLQRKRIYIYIYGSSLNTMILNCTGPLIHRCFFQLIHSLPLVSLGFASVESTDHKSKTIFAICGWESTDVDAHCMHSSMPFYIRDLSIFGFRYLQRVLIPVSSGMTVVKFLGDSKVIHRFLTAWRVVPQHLHCSWVNWIDKR